MIKIYVILGIIIILVLIFRKLIKKSKKKSCGPCLFPDKKTPPLKQSKSRKEKLEEIRKKIAGRKNKKEEKK